jgi:hypothetical protein
MEVMISFSERNESSDDVIARRIPVIKWLVAEPMSK